jgi:hypothetical protein
MKLVLISSVILLFIIGIVIFTKWIKKRVEHHEKQATTLSGKIKMFCFVYSMWIVACGVVTLGLSTSALGWQVLSIWLVKPILILALILTLFSYGTFHKGKLV